MEFGLLKTKVEKKLSENYNTNNFKYELKKFQKIILENKKLSQLFFIYDELSSYKGFDNDKANDYLNECVKIYENNINKLTTSEVRKIMNWVGDIRTNNEYKAIDGFFNTDLLKLESKISNKKLIIETIKKKTLESNANVHLPIKTLVNVANNSIQKYLEQLDENTKTELNKILSIDEKQLSEEYKKTKSEVLNKLTELKSNSDTETSQRIDESITKIQNEKFDKLNYYRLKTLNESI